MLISLQVVNIVILVVTVDIFSILCFGLDLVRLGRAAQVGHIAPSRYSTLYSVLIKFIMIFKSTTKKVSNVTK